MSETYYNASREKVLDLLQSSVGGLSAQEAAKRLQQHGYNELPKAKSFSWLKLVLSQFKSWLIYILLVAAVVAFILGDAVDAWVILVAVGLNVVVGFVQEWRAQKSLERLRDVVVQYAQVRRGGAVLTLENRELVPGDIVMVTTGNKVPADIRLIEAYNVTVDEAPLTGESMPVRKTTDALLSAVLLAEQKNMMFMGTTMVTGSALGVVTGTGLQTELGSIASLIQVTKEQHTPLQKKLAVFARRFGVMVLVIAFVIFIAGLVLGYDFRQMLTTAVAMAVAAVPEELAAAITVILAVSMQRILKKKALVRQLVAAETLGSTTVICTDKTGTLTEGKMRVVRIVTHNHDLDTTRHSIEHKPEDVPLKSYFLALKVGILASDAYIENPDEAIGHRNIIGSPTEKALILAASQAGFPIDALRQEHRRLEVLPFDSDKKYMASVHQEPKGQRTIYCKGAPEIVLTRSEFVDLDGTITKLDAVKRKKLQREYETLSAEGLRILALGFKKVGRNYSGIERDVQLFDGLVFVGFVGIKDPLRAEARDTIATCVQAGIRPIMLTGDHQLTAHAIAAELGLPHGENNIIEGKTFGQLDEKSLHERITSLSVYARLNPRDKLRIISAWQARGEVVAMTGDGVNDAPALKLADIGVALGSGTDVAKETADIVLLDNNFKTIVSAVRQGRIIYDNIKKVILYLISDSFTEMIIIAFGLFAGWPLPLLPVQILWINLVTDGLPNIALTVEPEEPGIMDEKPIARQKPILSRQLKFLVGLICCITGFMAIGIFYYMWKTTGDLDKARTMTFTAVAIGSLLYVFSCRTMRNPIWRSTLTANKNLLLGVLGGLLFQLLAIYAPFFQKAFQTVPLFFGDWVIVISIGLVSIVAIEVCKWFFFHRTPRTSNS